MTDNNDTSKAASKAAIEPVSNTPFDLLQDIYRGLKVTREKLDEERQQLHKDGIRFPKSPVAFNRDLTEVVDDMLFDLDLNGRRVARTYGKTWEVE